MREVEREMDEEEEEVERQVDEEGERFGKLYRSASNNQISYWFSI